VLSGMGTRAMVDQNCHSADMTGIGSLSADEMDVFSRLTEVFRRSELVPCTACEYCMPCPAGVNIPECFAILNNVSMEERRFHRWQVTNRYRRLAGAQGKVDRENPNGNASLCTQCGACVPKCPQAIDIPGELEKVHAVLAKRGRIEDYYGER